MKTVIWGDGAMGTACALLLAQRPENQSVIWSAFEPQARESESARENKRFLPGVRLPDNIRVTADPAAAATDASLAVAAIPTIYLRETLLKVEKFVDPATPIASIIKGIENDTFARPTEIIKETTSALHVAVLSGPSHAEEIARNLPASVVAASDDLETAKLFQDAFTTRRFRVYTNLDMLGVELAGALKNVIGIAAGVCDGLGFGDNAKSALLTRAVVEITRFGAALGAQSETFAGLAGMGDLITTCISPHGRNRRVGELLGQGKSLQEILSSMNSVAEGVATSKAVHTIAEKRGIVMPISTEVYRILYEGKSPLDAVNELMLRERRSE